MKKMLMIINNHSGLKNSKQQLLDAMEIFCKYDYQITTYLTQGVNDAFNYLKRNKIKYDVISVFGGDGTLNEVTNGIMTKKHKPMIGYFPSGTMNDFGSNFNLSKDFKVIAENICQDKYTEFDLGYCNGRYFNYVAAFGAMCDVPYTTTRKAKKRFGNLAYVFEGVTKIGDMKPVSITYQANGVTKKMDILFGLVFSGGRVSGQQLVSKSKSSINDGEFNVLLVENVEGIFDIPDFITILTDYKKYIHRFKATEIKIDFESDVKWDLDGEEFVPGKHVEIRNIKKALKIKA